MTSPTRQKCFPPPLPSPPPISVVHFPLQKGNRSEQQSGGFVYITHPDSWIAAARCRGAGEPNGCRRVISSGLSLRAIRPAARWWPVARRSASGRARRGDACPGAGACGCTATAFAAGRTNRCPRARPRRYRDESRIRQAGDGGTAAAAAPARSRRRAFLDPRYRTPVDLAKDSEAGF